MTHDGNGDVSMDASLGVFLIEVRRSDIVPGSAIFPLSRALLSATTYC